MRLYSTTMKLFIFPILMVVCFVHVASATLIKNIPQSELTALQDLYEATNGLHWNWRPTVEGAQWHFTKTANPCSENWQGLQCADNCFNSTSQDTICNIRRLQMFEYNLTGTIPLGISNLTHLNELSLISNELHGTIPATIFHSMNHLSFIDLSRNNFTGPIPELRTLSNLTSLLLNFNFLSGTIPTSLFSMTNISQLQLINNRLQGTIPQQIIQLSKIRLLYLSHNLFTGRLPRGMDTLPLLTEFLVASNNLTGSIPEEIYSIPLLGALDLAGNSFTGTLSSNISRLYRLYDLDISDNFLSGEMPAGVRNLTFISLFLVCSNMFTGTLDADIFLKWPVLTNTNWTQNSFSGLLPQLGVYNSTTGAFLYHVNRLLYAVEMGHNLFTGPLPEALLDIKDLNYIVVNGNFLTGSIANTIGNRTQNRLNTFDIASNLMSGTIPAAVGDLSELVNLLLFENLLSGSFPDSLHLMPKIVTLLAHNNRLSGNLHTAFQSAFPPQRLNNIDVSGNALTGTIPPSIFALPQLQTFAAVSNCLSGSLPPNICNATGVTTLALDGLSTSTSCQKRIFPMWFSHVNTYTSINSLQSGIPSCLFAMPNLQSLHLSGNGITATIPKDVSIGPMLTDLSLSHNNIGGIIPPQIQQHQWSKLDLSYNRLNGELDQSFAASLSGGQLTLEVNRLSGRIPVNITEAPNIAVLQGNIFQCRFSKDTLPQRDGSYLKYDCGSNSLNLSMYIWLGVVMIFAMVLVVAVVHYKKVNWLFSRFAVVQYCAHFLSLVLLWMSVFVAPPVDQQSTPSVISSLCTFGAFLAKLRIVSLKYTAVLLLVAMPIFTVLSSRFQTYTTLYAWSASCMYQAGETPAYVLLVVFTILIVMLMRLGFTLRVKSPSDTASATDTPLIPERAGFLQSLFVHLQSTSHDCQYALRLAPAIITNCVVIVSVNVGYVYITLYYGTLVVTVSQVLLAAFKLAWNDFAVRKLLSLAIDGFKTRKNGAANGATESEERKVLNVIKEDIAFRTLVLLFNNVLTPCLAIAMISPDCFYNAVQTPPAVQTVFVVTYCPQLSPSCSYVQNTFLTSYQPPFTYSYQCSSTIVASYASMYVYMFLIVAFVTPMSYVAMTLLHEHTSHATSMLGIQLFTLCDYWIPSILKPVSEHFMPQLKERLKGTESTPPDSPTAPLTAEMVDMSHSSSSVSSRSLNVVSQGDIPLSLSVSERPTSDRVPLRKIASFRMASMRLLSLTLTSNAQAGRTVFFSKSRFVLRVVTEVAILTTFGVVFPPLAAVICVSLISYTLFTQLTVGRFVTNIQQHKDCAQLMEILSRECDGVVEQFQQSFVYLLFFAALFYAFFLVDTLGDAKGFDRSVWIGAMMVSMPLVLYVLLWRFVYILGVNVTAVVVGKVNVQNGAQTTPVLNPIQV